MHNRMLEALNAMRVAAKRAKALEVLMVGKWIVPIALGLSCVAGCGGGHNDGPPPLSISAKDADGFTATLKQDSAVSSFQLTAHYTLSLNNETAAPMHTRQFHETLTGAFDFPGSVEILDGAGNSLYPGGTPPPPPIQGQWQDVAIPAGGAITKQVTVDIAVKPGTYRAYAHFDTDTTHTVVGPLKVTVTRPL